jgi:serine/threonine-protein kinase
VTSAARIASGIVAAVVLSTASAARADTNATDAATAEVLFDQGKKLLAEGKLDEACSKLAESNRLDSGIGTMLYLADCYERTKKTASAWAMFREASQLAHKQGDAREKVARDRATALEAKLAKLTVVVAPEHRIDGLVVTRDGSEMTAAQWSLELPVDPGVHRVTASAKGHKPWETTVTVSEAGSQKVDVPELAIAPPDAPAQDATQNGSTGKTQRTIGLVLGGVGIVGIGVGTYFGISAKSKADAAAPYCTGTTCQQPGIDDWSKAQSNGNIATVGFIAGGVLLAAGAVVYLIAPSPRAQTAALAVARGGFDF